MKISLPIVILNYKTYNEATGKRAMELSKIATKFAKEFGIYVVVCPQFVDIAKITDSYKIPVFAQHVDPITPGSHTGQILSESILAAGAVGTLLNHAEKQVPFDILEKTVTRMKELDLRVCVCAENVEIAGKIAQLNPDYVAFELPELIGSGKSISTTEPELVKSSVKQILEGNPNAVPLCGAGITVGDDVYAALKLGTEGVLLASAFAKAKDPKSVLRDLLNGVKRYLDEK